MLKSSILDVQIGFSSLPVFHIIKPDSPVGTECCVDGVEHEHY